MRTKRRVLAGKIEAAEGTPEVLTSAETGLIVIDPKFSPDIKMLQRQGIMATFSKQQDLAGAALGHIGFKAEVLGRSAVFAANNLPLLSPYFRACGLAETLDVTPGSEKVTYTRASGTIPCMTIALYADGVLKRVAGARGNVKFSGDVGGPLYAEFDFVGVYLPLTDAAMLTPTYVNLVPARLLGANYLIDAFSPVLKSFEVDLGNKLSGREDLNSASGYKSFVITDGDTRGKMDPEMVTVATHDYYGRWRSGLTGALSVGPFGSDPYNRIKLTAPKLVTTKVSEGEREGHEVVSVDFQLAMNTGDDEFALEIS